MLIHGSRQSRVVLSLCACMGIEQSIYFRYLGNATWIRSFSKDLNESCTYFATLIKRSFRQMTANQ